ncbi:hypothetical protein [Paraburkholderia sp. DGU8]|uniref:hypothetical protein n=1 Tax=Paraburkholderia sp. DGU8 TaxID=3161997 RepID=UPI003467E325
MERHAVALQTFAVFFLFFSKLTATTESGTASFKGDKPQNVACRLIDAYNSPRQPVREGC